MKHLFVLTLSLSLVFSSLPTWAQSASPVVRALESLETIKLIEDKEQSIQAINELISDVKRMNEKDHNQFLFAVLGLYEKEWKDNDFYIKFITLWEDKSDQKARAYIPPSAWSQGAGIAVAALGGILAHRMVKGFFTTPPLQSAAGSTTKMNSKLRNYLEQKFANFRLNPKMHWVSGTSGMATFVGLSVLIELDPSTYDAFLHGLLDTVGPENIEYFQFLYSLKIPPMELWQVMDTMILCENHNRLTEISQSREIMRQGNLSDADKQALTAYLADIDDNIGPRLESLRDNLVNSKNNNRMMRDGYRPKTDKQFQFVQKDTGIRSPEAKKITDRVLMCDQISLQFALLNRDQLRSHIQDKLK